MFYNAVLAVAFFTADLAIHSFAMTAS